MDSGALNLEPEMPGMLEMIFFSCAVFNPTFSPLSDIIGLSIASYAFKFDENSVKNLRELSMPLSAAAPSSWPPPFCSSC